MAWTKLITKCGCIQYMDIPIGMHEWIIPLPDRQRAKKWNEDLSNYYPILHRKFEFIGRYETEDVRVFVEAD